MIKLKQLIQHLLVEKMSYADLMSNSDSERKDRASRIPARSLVVKSVNDKEAWKFSYKSPSDENTTGFRHQGFIYFFKDSVDIGNNASDIPCSVDCSCPDYKFRFSFSNKQQGAGENGSNSLNKGLNYPSSVNQGPGLCKHLISLKEYLRTKVDAPLQQPSEPEQSVKKPVVVPRTPSPNEIPAEEPTEEPIGSSDPTQTPQEPESDELSTSSKPVEDPTQTPQKPESDEEPTPEEPDSEEEPLKEKVDKHNLFKSFDEFCERNPIFII